MQRPSVPHHIGSQSRLFKRVVGALNDDDETPMNASNSKVQILACMGFFKHASEMGNIYFQTQRMHVCGTCCYGKENI